MGVRGFGRRGVLVGMLVGSLLAAGLAPGAATPVRTAALATGQVFPDVPPSASFFTEISWLASMGITTGYPDGTYGPTKAVTRGAMAAFLYRFAGSPSFTPPVTARFPDVPVGASFYKEISWLASTKITTGYADGTYGPRKAVTRGAMAAFLYRSAGSPAYTPPAKATFTDVPVGASFYKEISWLSSTGITTGIGNGKFGPRKSVTRGAMAAFLFRFDHNPDLGRNETLRVSLSTGGAQANEDSLPMSISADGRWIAYRSNASNLVAGDTNGAMDIFVTDRSSGTTTRVSTSSDGSQGDVGSWETTISADGRWVAYTSGASNLVEGDTNGVSDVFLTDTSTGTTTRVSAASDGTQANGESYLWSVFDSTSSWMSSDGRWVTYTSDASNLVAGDTNGEADVFVTDTTTGATTRVSTATGGAQGNDWSWGPTISADGRWIAYKSQATNLVAGDTNGKTDIFVTDRTTGATTRVSTASDGTEANMMSLSAAISADGRWIAYESYASNLVAGDTNDAEDIFVTDRITGLTTLITRSTSGALGNSWSWGPSISEDGRWITYISASSNLVAGDTNGTPDAFVTDRTTGVTTRVSASSAGVQANDETWAVYISADGAWVTLGSSASNLVTGDTNDTGDVFASRNPLAP